MAAAATTRRMAATAARRDVIAGKLSRASAVAKLPRSDDMNGHAARLWPRLRWKHRRNEAREDSRGRDVDRPRRADARRRRTGRALHPGRGPDAGRDGRNRAFEPAL